MQMDLETATWFCWRIKGEYRPSPNEFEKVDELQRAETKCWNIQALTERPTVYERANIWPIDRLDRLDQQQNQRGQSE